MGFACALSTCQLLTLCLIIMAQRQESRDMCLTHYDYLIGHLVIRGSGDLLSKEFYTFRFKSCPHLSLLSVKLLTQYKGSGRFAWHTNTLLRRPRLVQGNDISMHQHDPNIPSG